MPEVIGLLVDHAHVVRRDRLAGHDVEVRLARELGAGGRIGAAGRLERAEILAELDLLLVVHRLVAEQQDRMLLEGGADRSELALRQRPRDVDAADLRAEQRMELGDLDRSCVAHGGPQSTMAWYDSTRSSRRIG